MCKFVTGICLFFLMGGFCFALDPAEGYWLSVDDKTGKTTAGWEIYQEEGKLYGKVLSTAEHAPDVRAERCKESYPGFPVPGKVNQMIVTGTPWIFGLTRQGEGRWGNGNVIDPTDGNMYKCRITYHPADGTRFTEDTLEMRGEIGLGIGRSQFWRKTNRETAASQSPLLSEK
ncbi:MAG: DUF2147 domain-containing protein [Treponema sp.]|jgi:uncharacterized protein (DUF2147 family)|nr:DUF2147 domain-containing protein [Treponema sp.]